MAVVPITAPTLDATAAQVGVSPYGQTAEQAQQAFRAAGEQVAQSRQAQMGATGAAAAGATMTEAERRRLRAQQEAMAGAVAGEGAVDTAAQQAQQAQLEYLRGLQATGGAQAATAKQQADLVAALQQSAAGTGTVAQQQLAQALQASQAATASQVAGLRGINPAAAQRLLTQQQAAQAAQAAGKAAELGLTEQFQAQQLLAQTIGQMRGQDVAAQESMAQQMAAALTTGRAQDIASGQLQTQRDQLAATILQGVRAGDVDAVNAAIASAQAQRQADINAQAQALGLFTAAGNIDLNAARLKVDQAIEQARLDFEAGKITRAEQQAEENYWRDFWTKMALGAAGAGTTALARMAVPGKAKGGRVDGRPLVKGDHPANDIVPALLSPGEIVIPRSIAQAADAPEKAAAFVRALQKAESAPLSRSAAARKIAALEAELAALRAARKEA